MRAPSLLAHCLTGLGAASEKGSPALTSFSDHLPSPAVEILPSKMVHPYKYAGENVDVQGLNVFKGRVSVADFIGFNGSETTSSKPEGYLKSWDSSIDLVNVLKHEIRDGQLSFRGKRVLELGCNYGLPGIFACLKGASTVHFQDVNAETIRCATIPNVLANMEQAREKQPSLAPWLRFFAGDWEELPTVLSLADDGGGAALEMRLSFSEDEFSDGQGSSSRKLSGGSRAWERASQADPGHGGYDILLLTDIPHSHASLNNLYALINKCLKPPYGVAYIAAKKNYVGFNSGVRHLRSLVDEEAVFGAHLVKEMADRDVWKFFLK